MAGGWRVGRRPCAAYPLARMLLLMLLIPPWRGVTLIFENTSKPLVAKSLLSLLIPSYFVSLLIETAFVSRSIESAAPVWTAVWLANLASYGMLFGLAVWNAAQTKENPQRFSSHSEPSGYTSSSVAVAGDGGYLAAGCGEEESDDIDVPVFRRDV